MRKRERERERERETETETERTKISFVDNGPVMTYKHMAQQNRKLLCVFLPVLHKQLMFICTVRNFT